MAKTILRSKFKDLKDHDRFSLRVQATLAANQQLHDAQHLQELRDRRILESAPETRRPSASGTAKSAAPSRRRS